MAKKPVTKIDPRKELSPYLNHEFNQQRNSRKSQTKISASLSNLQAERRRSLRRRLGLIMTVSVLAIAGLGYYISPLANISTVKIIGADCFPAITEPERASANSFPVGPSARAKYILL